MLVMSDQHPSNPTPRPEAARDLSSDHHITPTPEPTRDIESSDDHITPTPEPPHAPSTGNVVLGDDQSIRRGRCDRCGSKRGGRQPPLSSDHLLRGCQRRITLRLPLLPMECRLANHVVRALQEGAAPCPEHSPLRQDRRLSSTAFPGSPYPSPAVRFQQLPRRLLLATRHHRLRKQLHT